MSDRHWKNISEPGKGRFLERQYSVYLPMRDNVKIALEIYIPSTIYYKENFPVIFQQTRYWRETEFRFPFSLFLRSSGRQEALSFIKSGYVFIIADVRGSGASYGKRNREWDKEELEDSREILDWITRQDFCDGNIGVTGSSYDGSCAEFLLKHSHPNVKAVASRFSVFDVFSDIAFPGGIRLASFIEKWAAANKALDRGKPYLSLGWLVWLLVKGPKPVDRCRDELKNAIQEHYENFDIGPPSREIRFRDSGMINDASPHRVHTHLKQKNIPFYAFSGWYDGAYAHSAIKKFLTWNPDLARLTIGPWDHGGHQLIGPYAKKRRPDFPFMQEIIRFFDLHLKRMSGESDYKYKVSYYTIGYESWRFSDTWPPETSVREYYLSENSQLLFYKSANADSVRYITTPASRSGRNSRWDSLFNPFKKRIHYSDRKKMRSECLSFDSQILTEDVILTGSAEADLFISSDRPYGDIFLYLDEITEHGKIHYITEGILRMNFHSSKIKETPDVFSHRNFLTSEWKEIIPGQIIRIKIHFLPVSYRLKKGSKISLSIAGADSDHFENNYNEKYPVYTVYFSGRYKSRLLLPLEKNL